MIIDQLTCCSHLVCSMLCSAATCRRGAYEVGADRLGRRTSRRLSRARVHIAPEAVVRSRGSARAAPRASLRSSQTRISIVLMHISITNNFMYIYCGLIASVLFVAYIMFFSCLFVVAYMFASCDILSSFSLLTGVGRCSETKDLFRSFSISRGKTNHIQLQCLYFSVRVNTCYL